MRRYSGEWERERERERETDREREREREREMINLMTGLLKPSVFCLYSNWLYDSLQKFIIFGDLKVNSDLFLIFCSYLMEKTENKLKLLSMINAWEH